MPSARVPIVIGAGSFGHADAVNPTPLHTTTVEKGNAIIDLALKHGYDTYDTSSSYGGGTSETLLGEINRQDIKVDTKVNPSQHKFTPEGIRQSVQESVSKLGNVKINVLYLHAPDRAYTGESVHRTINELYKEGHFKEFGLSNFPVWEVAEYVERARINGWIKPTVYEGSYNAVQRALEHELFPALRIYGIRFYAYSPLGSGFLTNRFLEGNPKEGSPFHPSNQWAAYFEKKYGHLKPLLEALKPLAEKHGLSIQEIGYRWLQHHSALGPGDGVIVGGRGPEQFGECFELSEKGPLPDDVVKVVNDSHAKYAKYDPYWVTVDDGKMVI